MATTIRNTAVLRRAAGMTQEMAARYCGLSKRTISRFESKSAPLWYQHLMMFRSGRFPGWEGFKIEPGRIWTPANQIVLSTEVEHFRWMCEEFGHSERRATHEISNNNEEQLKLILV